MAYFANGSEGEYYEAKYCEQCVHYGEIGESCPILALHSSWNYDACNGNEAKATSEERIKHVALNTLWPRKKDGYNGQCEMFYEQTPGEIKG